MDGGQVAVNEMWGTGIYETQSKIFLGLLIGHDQ